MYFTPVGLVFMVWVVCNSHSCVSKLCKSKKGQLKCEWMAEVSLGSLALFPCCCTVELSWIYCIFFFEGRGLGWHLLQYCDDYLRIVNCTEFTLYSSFFLLGFLIKYVFLNFVFPSQTVENPIVQLQEFILPSALFFFSELWLRDVLKL